MSARKPLPTASETLVGPTVARWLREWEADRAALERAERQLRELPVREAAEVGRLTVQLHQSRRRCSELERRIAAHKGQEQVAQLEAQRLADGLCAVLRRHGHSNADTECPACRRAHDAMASATPSFKEALAQFHDETCAARRGGECGCTPWAPPGKEVP